MRIAEVILAAALLGTCFVGWAAADVTDSQAYVLTPESRVELIAFVKEAGDLVLKEGQYRHWRSSTIPMEGL